MWKGCAYANASRNALFAAMLAERGMTGPSPIFEGVGGYFKAVTHAPFRLAALGGRVHPYKIMECSIKRFPLGQYSQTVVQAALEAREKIRSAEEIAEVRIATGATAVQAHGGRPGQVGAGDARDGRPQHALYRRRGAHPRDRGRPPFRRTNTCTTRTSAR